MGSITGNFQTSLLMRVGSRESIENCYKTKTLQFGCAANWLDYALTCKNKSTGDIFECVFARVFKNDPRITSMKDSRGNPMGDHLLVLENESENISILRYVPTILLPVMCFYSFNVKKIIHKVDLANHPFKWFAFNLDEYCKIMDYNNDEASFLFITDPVRFFEELKTQIPIAINKNKNNLTSERFYGHFNPDYPVFAMDVDYHKHLGNEIFFDNPQNMEELFWKLPEYEQQSELRVVIPNINFKQIFDPDGIKYDYKLNTLNVILPHLQEYSEVVSAAEFHSLYFGRIDDRGNTGTFQILKETFSDLTKMLQEQSLSIRYNKLRKLKTA